MSNEELPFLALLKRLDHETSKAALDAYDDARARASTKKSLAQIAEVRDRLLAIDGVIHHSLRMLEELEWAIRWVQPDKE